MSELQAQIVFHGENQPDGLTIDHAECVYGELLNHIGVRPLKALIQIRSFQENRAIAHVTGQPVPDENEFVMDFELDPSQTEIWVDPDEFAAAGVACVFHRHIIVSPAISVDDMPSIDNVADPRRTIDMDAATKNQVELKAKLADWEIELLGGNPAEED